MKLWNSLMFYTKVINRTRIIPLLFMTNVVYTLFPFYEGRYGSQEKYGIINPHMVNTSVATLSSMALYLVMGLYLAKVDGRSSVYEVFAVIKNAIIYKTVAKWLLALSSLVLHTTVMFTVYVAFFYSEDFHNFAFFTSVLLYLILYVLLPSFVLFLCGDLLGTIIKGKIVFPFILLLYFCTTPILSVAFEDGFSLSFSMRLIKLLNLGEPNPTQMYVPFYGFSLEGIHWNKVFLVMFSLFLLFFILWKKKKQIENEVFKKVGTIVLIFIIFLGFYSFRPHQVLSDYYVMTNYYEANKSFTKSYPSTLKFTSYNGTLRPKSVLHANITVNAENKTTKPLHSAKISLFHELKLKNVKLNEKNISFSQQGDIVTLNFGKEVWGAKEKKKLSFEYAGLQSNLYYGNNTALYLPNQLPWLPNEDPVPAFSLETKNHSLHRKAHQPMGKKYYDITIEGDHHPYSNLLFVGENHLAGVSSEGVSLISGQLLPAVKNGTKYVLPTVEETQFNELDTVDAYIKGIGNTLEKGVNDKELSIPSHVYFLSNQATGNDGLLGDGTWWNNQDVTLGFSFAEKLDFSLDSLASYTPNLILGRVKSLSRLQEDYEFNILFSVVYARAANKELGLSIEEVNPSIESAFSTYLHDSEIKNELKSQLKTWMRNPQSLDPTNDVYKAWFSLIKKGNPDWHILSQLLETKKGV
ncbi:hypothetical protein SFC65_13425 [Priestia filamentosa]|uniref:hypothetical protein n=1 Tax=Priestia filamentosa TaxID=1402861 RepID=UPI0002FB7083|nr:hypothetical protein [Priestia filamentosa]